jgi:hypothetical protein
MAELSLKTKSTKTIKIDDVAYMLRQPSQLSMIEQKRLADIGTLMEAVGENIADASEKDIRAAGKEFNSIIRMVMPQLPRKVLRSLGLVHKVMILNAYSEEVKDDPFLSQAISRTSKGSTAGVKKSGKKPQS